MRNWPGRCYRGHASNELKAELAAIEAESIGWQPLGDGAYLHLGKPDEEEIVITVAGVPEVGMAGMNVLLAGW
ncbi:MAG: hypothetical protein L6Q55_12005 [Azonexus sp.]|nr:hypothetical protein [Azonexus sp.]MCK6413132.1 hypothetical protein [Azonexus sp.]